MDSSSVARLEQGPWPRAWVAPRASSAGGSSLFGPPRVAAARHARGAETAPEPAEARAGVEGPGQESLPANAPETRASPARSLRRTLRQDCARHAPSADVGPVTDR